MKLLFNSISLSVKRNWLGYRRRYRRVYRFVRIFATEIRDELYNPNYFQFRNNIYPDWPAYYLLFRIIKSIPRNIVDSIEKIKFDYLKVVNDFKGKNVSVDHFVEESKGLYSELSPNAGRWMRVALVLYKESVRNFAEGYQDALNGVSFSSSANYLKKKEKL